MPRCRKFLRVSLQEGARAMMEVPRVMPQAGALYHSTRTWYVSRHRELPVPRPREFPVLCHREVSLAL